MILPVLRRADNFHEHAVFVELAKLQQAFPDSQHLVAGAQHESSTTPLGQCIRRLRGRLGFSGPQGSGQGPASSPLPAPAAARAWRCPKHIKGRQRNVRSLLSNSIFSLQRLCNGFIGGPRHEHKDESAFNWLATLNLLQPGASQAILLKKTFGAPTPPKATPPAAQPSIPHTAASRSRPAMRYAITPIRRPPRTCAGWPGRSPRCCSPCAAPGPAATGPCAYCSTTPPATQPWWHTSWS